MGASRRAVRTRLTGRLLAAGLSAAGLSATGVLAAGCETLDDAQRVIEQGNIASDLATRFERTDDLTYTAQYQLAGGAQATIAKDREPNRVAYTYPGGKLIVAPNARTDCRTKGTDMSCTVTGGPSPDQDSQVALLNELTRGGMIAPPLVVSLLNATALDSDAQVLQRDTTIAGQHATCVNAVGVDNAAASSFDACVTTDGVLGSFTGVVNGDRIDLALTQYRGSVTADAFDPPSGATLADQRVPHS